MSDQVTVYSTPTCPWCDRAKTYLKENKVPFVEKDVSMDRAAAMEMIRRSGQQGVPVITTNSEVIVGFDQARLAKIVKDFSGPKRPPLGLLAADAESYLARHPEIAAKFPPGTKGVYVGDIRAGSVAEKSAVQRGDIVAAVAGKRVRNMTDLDRIIENVDVGQSVSVRVLRGQEDLEATFQF
jgi:glutaredoxin-like YruB-family protein